MRAVVLVGGFGTRLRPLTLTRPKQMLPVAGAPMIERVVAHLATHGIDEAVLSLGYRPDAFTAAYPDFLCAGVRLAYAVEPEPLDTAGAIRFAATEAAIDERFLVVNGDVLTEIDVTALVSFHDEAGAEGTIALTKVDDPSQFGVVPTDAAGRVTEFVEKPRRDQAPTDLINAGFYVLEPSVLQRIPAAGPVNVERETFPAMVADGALYARPDSAYWIDVGTPERYLRANLDRLEGGDPSAPSGPAAVVDGEVVMPCLLGAGAQVAGGAVADRSVLGEGVALAAGARVEQSVLLRGAVVQEGALVRDSVIGADASVGARAVVEGISVVGDGVEVGAGEHVSGARIPEPEG